VSLTNGEYVLNSFGVLISHEKAVRVSRLVVYLKMVSQKRWLYLKFGFDASHGCSK
jgi:hypothetical protein